MNNIELNFILLNMSINNDKIYMCKNIFFEVA